MNFWVHMLSKRVTDSPHSSKTWGIINPTTKCKNSKRSESSELENVLMEPSMVISRTQNQELSLYTLYIYIYIYIKLECWDYMQNDKIWSKNTCPITSIMWYQFKVMQKVQALSLTKNFVLPETASRLHEWACYFSATCNWPWQMINYIMRQIWNANKNPVCFNITSFNTVNNVSAKLVVIKHLAT
jgi:hypothetical protein